MTLAYFRTNPMLLVLICALATGLPLGLLLTYFPPRLVRWAFVIAFVFFVAYELGLEAARAAH